jgi:UDP-2,3-diacylglucosamine pyrophosphatase LpxH
MKVELRPDLRLPKSTRVLIVSDIHLGDGSAGDLFGNKDDLFLDVLRREGGGADVVIVNGDAVDHMQARSSKRMERAHPRVFEALREMSERKPVIYVLGNHEDALDLQKTFPNFDYVHTLRVGDDLCVTHGHQFDLHWKDGGTIHTMAKLHSLVETFSKRPVRQPFRDYANFINGVIHIGFFRWTQLLRARGAAMKALGKPEAYERWQRLDNFWARGQWGDLGCIFQSAEAYLTNGAPWQTLVLGHSHQPGVVAVGPERDRTYVNVGSWALELATFARIEGGRARVFDAHTGREFGDERYRMLLSGAALPDMRGWFERYYRGFFRYDLDAIRRDFPPYTGA